ncbi:dihydrodipicolinate synthase family protein [Microbacterium sp. ASV49]|uniref:Dihydrodipicolinate synthase family protein n=1 Tax=Microbacterium candidum TaxID=3041922 RepID=A0ABT7MTN1_9MICO|nr:dihydrodipicolinate synthase family protein [Microbacterium sp. ASV49]MDL9977788.1 dihydrodipicolinate synthase family protein [Microbacterium sp. ASV49]
MSPEILTGVLPVAPTIFKADETVDEIGQRRVMDFLVDSGVAAICVLANYSEQFSLDDGERTSVMRTSIEAVRGRVPVVVTTSHFSARIAAERSREARDAGADMVMLMPPFFGTTLRCGDDDVVEYFKRVTDGLDIDVMIQDAPMSATPLSVDLLSRLAREIPTVRYAKIEVARAAQKIRDVAASAGADLPGLFDGEESVTLIPDLDAGAVGTMCSALLPDLLVPAVRSFLAGDRDDAVSRWERALPLIQFENRQCGLRAAKIALAEGGVIGSDACRAPLEGVSEETRRGLLEMLRRVRPLVLDWAS